MHFEKGQYYIDTLLDVIMIFQEIKDEMLWFYSVDDDCYMIYSLDNANENIRRY